MYLTIKTGSFMGMEEYVYKSKHWHVRRVLACFRTGSHWLEVNHGSYGGVPYEQRFCPHCPGVVDTEDHHVFDCPHNDDIRVKQVGLLECDLVTRTT